MNNLTLVFGQIIYQLFLLLYHFGTLTVINEWEQYKLCLIINHKQMKDTR